MYRNPDRYIREGKVQDVMMELDREYNAEAKKRKTGSEKDVNFSFPVKNNEPPKTAEDDLENNMDVEDDGEEGPEYHLGLEPGTLDEMVSYLEGKTTAMARLRALESVSTHVFLIAPNAAERMAEVFAD